MAYNPVNLPPAGVPHTQSTGSSESKKRKPQEGDTVTDIFGVVWVFRNGQFVRKAGQTITDPVSGKQYKVVSDGVLKEVEGSETNPLGSPPKVPAGQNSPPG